VSDGVDHGRFVRNHRSLFLSDLHLGAIGSRADLVLGFLKGNRADTYLLVGDILDRGHPLTRWSAEHQAVVDYLRARKDAGAEVVYVRGNHDPAPDDLPRDRRLPAAVVGAAVHVAADGRRYLVVHGDEADARALRSHLMTRVGSLADQVLRGADTLIGQYVYSGVRDRRSAIEALLWLANRGLAPGRRHERRLAAIAGESGFDGVICGHFHLAAIRDLRGVSYANCGDWMDSFTALAEDFDGGLHLLGGRDSFAATPRPALRRRFARA